MQASIGVKGNLKSSVCTQPNLATPETDPFLVRLSEHEQDQLLSEGWGREVGSESMKCATVYNLMIAYVCGVSVSTYLRVIWGQAVLVGCE